VHLSSLWVLRYGKYHDYFDSSCLVVSLLQVCARGFFLSEQETCLPCNCKGHADSCEDITGICIECQDHTFGDFCDQCEDRYLPGFHSDGTFVCRPCACPLSLESNNFATRCDKRGNFLRCVCQEGYAGHYCERCAPGFYGNPMELGNSCKKCDCNGNSDPNLIFNECNNVTGECLNCWGNTSGDNCERCAPGFYGDAISAKDCRECDCPEENCDMHSGECLPEASKISECNIDCDACIWSLIGDIRQSNKTLDQVRNSVLNISTGAAANDRLKYYNYTAHRLQVTTLKPRTVYRNGQTQKLLTDMELVAEEVPLIPALPDFLYSFILKFLKGEGCHFCTICVTNHSNHFTLMPTLSMMRDWELYGVYQELDPQVKLQKIAEAERILGWMRNLDLSSKEPLATDESSEAHECEVFNVREQHAEIDGARVLLERKTEKLSQSDRDLVLRAEDHADDLQRHAEELQYNLKGSDANGHVQKALNAFTVYDNIVKNIDDANITALTALNISSSTHDVICLCVCVVVSDRTPKRLQFTQEVAEGTLNRSAEVLQMVTPILKRVEEWDSNMKNEAYSAVAFERTVLSAGEAVEDLSEIVPELLSKLRVVEEKKPVNNVSTNIMKIRELIAQARSVAKKVQVSMKFNGQSSVEVHPHSNLDELKTVTSISFYIRVDPDKDPIEDRFLLYLGDKQGRKDYMGLAIKNDNLVYVYNLGGEVVEIPLSSKPVSSWPPVFNLVKVERLGRHGKLFLTVPSQDTTAEQKFIQKGEADGTDSLFDLDPKDNVFIVGGVPPDVKLPPALTLAPFVGCIELETLNSDVISLYNFKQLHKMNVLESMPCPRHKLAFSQSRVTSFLFDGSGFALVNNIERRGKIGIVTRFDIEVRTVANNGILFLMVNEANFFILELKNGFLRLMYDFGFTNGPVIMESNLAKLQINDARYHEVSVIYHHSKKIILLVDRSHVKSMENEKKPLPFSDIYIGGAPSSILLSRPELSSLVGLKGCVKGFQFQKNVFNLLEEQGTIGISSGCPEESFMSRKVYFTGDGYLGSTAKISPFQSFEGGLNFRTLQSNGLLFYHRDGLDEFSLSVENGAVVLQSKGTRVRSHKKNYNDGRSHFLVASVTNQKYELVIDDKDKQDKKKPSSSSQSDNVPKTFYYGGSSTSSIQNFTGCISYAYISRQDRDIEPEDFQRYSENVQVSLQDCPLERPPAALHNKDSRESSRRSPGHSRKVGRDESSLPHGLKNNPLDAPETEVASCYLSSRPRVTRHAHHYGGFAHSRHEYTGIANKGRVCDFGEASNSKSHFSLSLKTQSAFGLIFYLADESEENFMALFLTHGRLVFTFSSGQNQVRIRSKEKYSDGQWHDIIFIRSGNTGRLIIDGLTVLEDRAPGGNISLLVQDPLFVGGVPPDQAKKNIQKTSVSGFSGCVRSLQLNGRWLTSASHSFGVTPCYEGPSEPGTYFTEEGGYVLLDDSFNFGSRFKMVIEVRPRVASGVLLHVFTGEKEYLTLYIYQNQVVVVVNNGIHEFSTYVSPRQEICDGNWHKITVIRDGNVVQLDVDSEVNHVVGPVRETAQNSSSPVFIGGAPASMLPHSLHSRRGYTGCMRNLSVNESPVSFSKAALVSGAVGVGACPAA
uniref:Laminin, alpha 4 n=1 Tax=Sinocyclocheilus anshuiensis TaxID=1608454 RepID=A0A671QHU2_9TELE